MNARAAFLSLVLLMAVAGCGKTPETAVTLPSAAAPGGAAAPQREESARPADIPWYEGSVEDAFAAAKAQNKPVLLYWGAIWCPPCHQLKATVFADPAFIEKTKLFVPLYLDGDEEGAQRWGEHFRITGYPTLLALNPDETEIRRIAGGLDLNQFSALLDDALENRSGVMQTLIRVADVKSAKPSMDECRRLAWNAWGLSDELSSDAAALARQLETAAQRCASVDTQLGLRLTAFAVASAGVTAAAGGAPLEARHIKALEELLAETNAAVVNLDALRNLVPQTFEALARSHASTAVGIAGRYESVMLLAADRPSFATADQLGALYSALLARNALQGEHADGALEKAARTRVEKELAALPADPYLRSGVVTGLLEVQDALGDHEQAYAVARREVDTSKYGYYFMATLASICESLGRKDEALEWYERSYEESKGAATRFQWGASYLGAVLRLTPEDLPRVRSAGNAVLNELARPDAIYQRSRIRLSQLGTKLAAWQAAAPAQRKAVVTELRKTYEGLCGRQCADFLEAA